MTACCGRWDCVRNSRFVGGSGVTLYPRSVANPVKSERSPTVGLLLGLVVTLAAVVAYTGYITYQIKGLRELQSNIIDRNRKDSLQLLRIQNDLNSAGHRHARHARRHRAVSAERVVGAVPAHPAGPERCHAEGSGAVDGLSHGGAAALHGRVAEAVLGRGRPHVRAGIGGQRRRGPPPDSGCRCRRIRRRSASRWRGNWSPTTKPNSRPESASRRSTSACSGRCCCSCWPTLVPIVLTSLYLIRSNRLLFQRLSDLSEQRSELAQKLIATQESTLLHISRELHDEFGQILTAIGSMLRRAGRQAPEGSPLRADLVEVSEIAQSTLDKVRSLSQALHPVTLEEAGLESTVDWYLPVVERQNGIVIHYSKTGDVVSGGKPRGHSRVSRAAGGAEQRHPAFGHERNLGEAAVPGTARWNWMWKTTAADFSPTASGALGWWRCGNARSC